MTTSAGESALAFLRSLEIFDSLAGQELSALAGVCRFEEHAGGTVIFREGDEAERLYIVVDGAVEVWKAYGSPEEEKIVSLGRGRIFGEMALVDGEPRSATVVAASPLKLFAIAAGDFREMLRVNPSLAFSIQKLLATRVRHSTDRFIDDLQGKNRKLEEILKELRLAQDELLRRERLSTVGRCASLILHDIRKPVTAVMAYADLLLHRDDLSAAAKEYAVEIKRGARVLDEMAREMLDYSRGDIRLEIADVALDDFMDELGKILEGMVLSRKIGLSVACEVRGSVPFDRERMTRVFYNLADNAVKSMGQSGTLTVKAAPSKDGLLFTVADTGRGMDSEALGRIFEPFFSHEGGGTGLGMVAVKNVVEAHGGSVTVESRPGEGTTVLIALPSQRRPAEGG
jgi:signal transduction histidine kinase